MRTRTASASAAPCIRHHTSAYVSIREHTRAYVRIGEDADVGERMCVFRVSMREAR